MCHYKTLHLHLYLCIEPIQLFFLRNNMNDFLCVWLLILCFLLLTTFQQCAVKLLQATTRRAEKRPAIGCSGSPAPPEGRRLRVPAAVVHLHRSTPPKTKGYRSPGHFVNIAVFVFYNLSLRSLTLTMLFKKCPKLVFITIQILLVKRRLPLNKYCNVSE